MAMKVRKLSKEYSLWIEYGKLISTNYKALPFILGIPEGYLPYHTMSVSVSVTPSILVANPSDLRNKEKYITGIKQ